MKRTKDSRSIERQKRYIADQGNGKMSSADFFESSELEQTLQEMDCWLKNEYAQPLNEEEARALLDRVTRRIDMQAQNPKIGALQAGTANALKAYVRNDFNALGKTERQKQRRRPWRLAVAVAAALICFPVLLTFVYVGLPASESDSIERNDHFAQDVNDEAHWDENGEPDLPIKPSDELGCGWEDVQGALLIQIGGQTADGGFETEAVTGYGSGALKQAAGGQVHLQWAEEAASPMMDSGQLWLVFVLSQTDEGCWILSDQYVRLDSFSADTPALPLLQALCAGTDSAYPVTADELLALMEKLN